MKVIRPEDDQCRFARVELDSTYLALLEGGKMSKLLFGSIGMALLLLVSTSTNVLAQDCRGHCLHCDDSSAAPEWYESSGFGEPNGWKGACSDDFCASCAPEKVREVSVVTEAIVDAVRNAGSADMSAVVREYGDYLLVQPNRDLLVVKGLGCDPSSLGAVVPLTRQKVEGLISEGVGDLAAFIEAREREAPVLPVWAQR